MQLHEHLPPLPVLIQAWRWGLASPRRPLPTSREARVCNRLGRTRAPVPARNAHSSAPAGTCRAYNGDFGRAPGNARVPGARRQVGIGFGGKLEFTALAGDLPQQELIQNMGGQPLVVAGVRGDPGVAQDRDRRLGAGGHGDRQAARRKAWNFMVPKEVRTFAHPEYVKALCKTAALPGSCAPASLPLRQAKIADSLTNPHARTARS
jgi:hypothetical protein